MSSRYEISEVVVFRNEVESNHSGTFNFDNRPSMIREVGAQLLLSACGCFSSEQDIHEADGIWSGEIARTYCQLDE